MGKNYVNYEREMTCSLCGKVFIARAFNTKYCDDCKSEARRAHMREYSRIRKAKKAEKSEPKQKIDTRHYADIQKERTLAMLPKIEI